MQGSRLGTEYNWKKADSVPALTKLMVESIFYNIFLCIFPKKLYVFIGKVCIDIFLTYRFISYTLYVTYSLCISNWWLI